MTLPDYITTEQWDEWVTYRLKDKVGKKFSERAQNGFLRKCARLHADGYDVAALIDHAMDVDWLTVWPKDEFRRKQRTRETMVTDLRLVETVDKEVAASRMAELKAKARGA